MILIASQVNRLLLNKWSSFINSPENPMKVLYPLKNRGLVKVSGPDAAPFLQGLITNDMYHLEAGAQSLYAMFLSNKGRVLYDTLVHKWGTENDNTFMLECDKSIQHLLQQHLKIYKLRRAIKIEDVNEMYKLWAFITPSDVDKDCCVTDMKHNLTVYKDPRLAELGHRLITTPDLSHVDIRQAIGNDIVIKNDEKEYQALRYRLGVSEGADDLFPGTCFPLEANCDYLHGVSFHKGCYIGQELTARVHHTGVVRKRIMPIQLLDIKKEEDLQRDATIWAENEKGRINLGKFKVHTGSFGLGLVRIKEALEAKSLNLGENTIEVVKPHWWPVEAPKENLKPSQLMTSQIQLKTSNTMEAKTPKEDPVPIVYDFKCTACGLDEKPHYQGTNPPFSRNIVLKYPSYVMKDPFSPPGKGEILVLGSDCTICGQNVCINKECSLFYKKMYCLGCANKLIETFPVEIKSKLVQIKKK